MPLWVVFGLGSAVGLLLGAWLAWLRSQATLREARAQHGLLEVTTRSEIAALREHIERLGSTAERLESAQHTLSEAQRRIATLEAQESAAREAFTRVDEERKALAERVSTLNDALQTKHVEEAQLETRLKAAQAEVARNAAFLEESKAALTHVFKGVAAEILEDKSKRFTEQNKVGLEQLLMPLRTKLQEFQGKVEEVYIKEGQQRSALEALVRQQMTLNQNLSEDARNLTQALRGSNKAQGNWGELILERVLESAGLRRGEEYDVQVSHTLEDGSRQQPDVTIHLPEERHLVIDAKVSLLAYEQCVLAQDESEKERALKRHLDSLRAHIKGLSEKNYQELHQINSFDCVLMFIPIEPAFSLAVSQDNDIFMDAWRRNVLLVSPSTLLFVLRTVAHLWRQEEQKNNVREIAHRGAELYDRLVGFVDELDTVGKRLEQAQSSFTSARSKLSTGRGNVIRQAEMLKQLGVKPKKSLPQTPAASPENEYDDTKGEHGTEPTEGITPREALAR